MGDVKEFILAKKNRNFEPLGYSVTDGLTLHIYSNRICDIIRISVSNFKSTNLLEIESYDFWRNQFPSKLSDFDELKALDWLIQLSIAIGRFSASNIVRKGFISHSKEEIFLNTGTNVYFIKSAVVEKYNFGPDKYNNIFLPSHDRDGAIAQQLVKEMSSCTDSGFLLGWLVLSVVPGYQLPALQVSHSDGVEDFISPLFFEKSADKRIIPNHHDGTNINIFLDAEFNSCSTFNHELIAAYTYENYARLISTINIFRTVRNCEYVDILAAKFFLNNDCLPLKADVEIILSTHIECLQSRSLARECIEKIFSECKCGGDLGNQLLLSCNALAKLGIEKVGDYLLIHNNNSKTKNILKSDGWKDVFLKIPGAERHKAKSISGVIQRCTKLNIDTISRIICTEVLFV